MNGFEFDDRVRDEPISSEELRPLLVLLGERQFGGENAATVGAVIEATGAPASDVIAALETVRNASFEERFGQRLEELRDESQAAVETVADDVYRLGQTLEDHEQRLQSVERGGPRPHGRKRQRPVMEPYRFGPETSVDGGQILAVILVVVTLLLVAISMSSSSYHRWGTAVPGGEAARDARMIAFGEEFSNGA